jgi:predicted DNA-binding protein with PD1-like motif
MTYRPTALYIAWLLGLNRAEGPALHLHAVLVRADGSVIGGHLLEAHVRPTLEVILTQPPSYLRKRRDQATGLPRIAIPVS